MTTYASFVREIENGGSITPSRLGRTKELLNAQFTFMPGYMPNRERINYGIGWSELLQLLSGVFDPESLKRVAPNADHSLFTQTMAYGPRIIWQMEAILDELIRTSDSRRAVIFVGQSTDNFDELPCTISIHFYIRFGVLRATVNMRSWDAIKGLPYDVMMFGGLTMAVGAALGRAVGPVTVNAASAHIYEAEWCTKIRPPKQFDIPHFHDSPSYLSTTIWAREQLPLLEQGIMPSWVDVTE